jgi:hypothetical protein
MHRMQLCLPLAPTIAFVVKAPNPGFCISIQTVEDFFFHAVSSAIVSHFDILTPIQSCHVLIFLFMTFN